MLTSFPDLFTNFGILLGYVSNYAFAQLPLYLGWRVMLGIGVAPYVLLGLMVFVMPESPRWLVMIHEELKMAASVSLWRGHLLAQRVVASGMRASASSCPGD